MLDHRLTPRPGARCSRCHCRAPRADGIPCALCAPVAPLGPEVPAGRRRVRYADGGGTASELTLIVCHDPGDEDVTP